MRNKKITPALQWREQIPQCRSSLAQDTPSPLATSHFLNAIHSVQRGAQVVMSLGFPPVLLTLQDTGETVHLDFWSLSFHPLGGIKWLCLLKPWCQQFLNMGMHCGNCPCENAVGCLGCSGNVYLCECMYVRPDAQGSTGDFRHQQLLDLL